MWTEVKQKVQMDGCHGHLNPNFWELSRIFFYHHFSDQWFSFQGKAAISISLADYTANPSGSFSMKFCFLLRFFAICALTDLNIFAKNRTTDFGIGIATWIVIPCSTDYNMLVLDAGKSMFSVGQGLGFGFSQCSFLTCAWLFCNIIVLSFQIHDPAITESVTCASLVSAGAHNCSIDTIQRFFYFPVTLSSLHMNLVNEPLKEI